MKNALKTLMPLCLTVLTLLAPVQAQFGVPKVATVTASAPVWAAVTIK